MAASPRVLWRMAFLALLTFFVGCAAHEREVLEVISLREALGSLTLGTARAEGWRLLYEDKAESSADNATGGDDDLLFIDSNDTNSSNLSASTLEHIQAVTQLIVGPIALFVGQDVEQLLHVMNGLMVGGISALMTQIQTMDKLDPMTVISVFGVLTATVGAIAATLQNPAAGAIVQGGVIFKQISAIVTKMLYANLTMQLGGCAGISTEISVVYPHGVPENCTRHIDIPYYGTLEGEDVALWLMTGVEYGLVAVGAFVSPYLAILMCIFNAATVGGHMMINAATNCVMIWGKKWGWSNKELKGAKYVLHALAGPGFLWLVGSGCAIQILMRVLRKKGEGHAVKHLRFRATEARGGGSAWASISDLRLTFHKVPVDIPDEYQEAPKEGQKSWAMTFEKPVNLTSFCFMSGGTESKPEDDPVSWVVEMSEIEGDEPPAEGDASWKIINEEKQVKVPKARNARSDFYQFEAPREATPEESTGAGIAAGATAAAAAVGATAAAAASAAQDTATKAADEAKSFGAKVKRTMGNMKTRALKLKSQAADMQKKVKEKTTYLQKLVAWGKDFMKNLVKAVIAPFTVVNHVVRELTDQTSGKDKKSKKQIVLESLHALGWDQPMLRSMMQQTLNMLLQKYQVDKATIMKIVNSANDEELHELFLSASNQQFGAFVKDLEDVLRKLIEEEEEEMKEILKPIQDNMDLALREFYMGEASLVVAKEFYTSAFQARMYLLTLQDITKPDGTVVVKGKFADLDPADTGPKDIKALNAYLEKMAGGHAFAGRTQAIAKMKKWYEETEKQIHEYIKAEMGTTGKIMLKAHPLIKAYPRVMKHVTLVQKDPAGETKKFVAPYKDKLMKMVKSKAAGLQKQATDAAMGQVAAAEQQAKDAAAGLQAQATEAAQSAAGAAAGAAQSAAGAAAGAASGLDLEAQTAAKSLQPDAKHGAPPEESDTAYVAMQDDGEAFHAADDAHHDAVAAMVEKKGNLEMCIDEMHTKIGLTLEQAQRLANKMTEADRTHAAACGGVTLPEVMKLADQHGVHFNKEKAQEKQKLVQAHKMKNELKKAGPPYQRAKASKKAENMTPNDISNRMSKPAAHRPPNPPDMTQVVKGLKKQIEDAEAQLAKEQAETKRLEGELSAAQKAHAAGVPSAAAPAAKESAPALDEEAGLKRLIEARADPSKTIAEKSIKKLMEARADPKVMIQDQVNKMVKQIPPEAAEKAGASPSDPPEKIVKALLDQGANAQEMLQGVVDELLKQDNVKAILEAEETPAPEDPEAGLKCLLDARANPQSTMSEDTVKKLMDARADPKAMVRDEVTKMVKQIPAEAAQKAGVSPSDPPQKIVKAMLDSGADAQEMLQSVVDQLLAEDNVKAILEAGQTPAPEDPEAGLKCLLDARANPQSTMGEDTVKKLMNARADPKAMVRDEVNKMVKEIPDEAAQKAGVSSSDPPEKIVKAMLDSGADAQELLQSVVDQLLAQDNVKAILEEPTLKWGRTVLGPKIDFSDDDKTVTDVADDPKSGDDDGGRYRVVRCDSEFSAAKNPGVHCWKVKVNTLARILYGICTGEVKSDSRDKTKTGLHQISGAWTVCAAADGSIKQKWNAGKATDTGLRNLKVGSTIDIRLDLQVGEVSFAVDGEGAEAAKFKLPDGETFYAVVAFGGDDTKSCSLTFASYTYEKA